MKSVLRPGLVEMGSAVLAQTKAEHSGKVNIPCPLGQVCPKESDKGYCPLCG